MRMLFPCPFNVAADELGGVMVEAYGHVSFVEGDIIYPMRGDLCLSEGFKVMIKASRYATCQHLSGSFEIPDDFLLLGVYA